MGESELARATRSSIKKNFPLGTIMSNGGDNPITLHSVDDELFARVWALIAETLCVTVVLSRTTKEAVATLVSERNSCPVCIAAHTMRTVISTDVDKKERKSSDEGTRKKKVHEEALQYAGCLLDELNHKRKNSLPSSSQSVTSPQNKDSKQFLNLCSTAKAEVALMVTLFDHINRVVSVIMGEEMSTAMFSLPRSMAKVMEKPTAIRSMSKLMSPLFSGAFKAKLLPGMTSSLFDGECKNLAARKALPKHLQGSLLAGMERANAVRRLVEWVEYFEQNQMLGIISEDALGFLEHQSKRSLPDFSSPDRVVCFVEDCIQNEASMDLDPNTKESDEAIVTVLLLSSFAPKKAYRSKQWNALVDSVGQDMARLIVSWWSLRCTLKEAQGLNTEIDARALLRSMNLNTVLAQ